MKRTELLRRSWMPRGTKGPTRKAPLAKVNVAKAQKRQRERKASQAAYRGSLCYRAVEQRSGGRCEFAIPRNGAMDRGDRMQWATDPDKWARCPAPATDHHHARYRGKGQERPEDVIHGCEAHHRAYEQIHRGYRAAQRARLA